MTTEISRNYMFYSNAAKFGRTLQLLIRYDRTSLRVRKQILWCEAKNSLYFRILWNVEGFVDWVGL